MSLREIIHPVLRTNINILCGKKRCKKCEFVDCSGTHCFVFTQLLSVNKKGKLLRCERCLSSELVIDEIYPGEEEAYRKDRNPDDEDWEVV